MRESIESVRVTIFSTSLATRLRMDHYREGVIKYAANATSFTVEYYTECRMLYVKYENYTITAAEHTIPNFRDVIVCVQDATRLYAVT